MKSKLIFSKVKSNNVKFIPIIIFTLFLYITPAYFLYSQNLVLISSLIGYVRMVVSAIYLGLVLHRGRVPTVLMWVFGFLMTYLFSSIIGELNMASWINTFFTIIGFFSLILFWARKDIKSLLRAIFVYFFVVLLINDILMVTHPLYLFTIKNDLGTQAYHFASFKNAFSMFTFPLLISAHLSLEHELISKKIFVVAFILAIVPSFIALAVTAFTCMLLFEFLLFCSGKYGVIKSKKFWVYLIIIAFVFQLLFTYLFRTEFIQYIVSEVMHKDPTLSGRAMIWDSAHEMIKSYFFLGRGNGKNGYYFYSVYKDYLTGSIMWAHNTSLDLLVQGGIALFICFYGIIISSIKRLFGNVIFGKKDTKVLLAALLAYTIMGCTERFDFRIDFYLILALSMCINQLIQLKEKNKK